MKSKNLTLCGRILTAFLMIFCVTACSDDNEEDIKVVFPEKQNLTGKASDTEFLDLSFNVDVDWTLTSSAAWCYFVPQQGGVPKESAPDSKLRTISGNAGKQTVKIGISDEGQNFEKEDLATITIRMNGEEQVLAQVTRSTKERELKVYKKTTDADGEVSWVEMGKDEAIFAGYDKDSTYMVKANFTFAATSLPEWLEKKPITGNANVEVEFGIKANEDKPEYFKNPNEGTIVFQAQDNENVTFSRKVGYEGMDPNKIIIDTFFPQWNWEVSMDGQTFTSLAAPGEDSDPVSYEKFLDKWTLIARNDAYEMVYVEKTVQYSSMPVFRTCPAIDDDEVDWIHTEILEGNKVKITVDPAETEREGYVLAFPKAVYDEKIKKGDPWKNLIEDNEVKYEYRENNLLLNFKQTKTSQPGEKEIKIVSIYWESYDKELELGGQSEIDAAIGDGFTEFLVGEYSVTANNVYSVKSSECNSVEIHVPFDVTSENQFDAYYMPNAPTLGKALEKGSNGNIGLSEDADTKKVGLWNIQDTSDPIIVILKEDMEEGNYVNRYVIVVLPSKE